MLYLRTVGNCVAAACLSPLVTGAASPVCHAAPRRAVPTRAEEGRPRDDTTQGTTAPTTHGQDGEENRYSIMIVITFLCRFDLPVVYFSYIVDEVGESEA